VAVLASKHEDRILEAAPALADKLDAAHKKLVSDFWRVTPLARKADSSAAPAITATEAAAIKEVVNKLTGDAWSQALYDELSVMVETGYINAGDILQAAGLDLKIDWNTVPAITLDAIRKHAEDFAFMVNQREQQALFDVIDAAVAEGQTTAELAGIIGDTFSEGYHVTDDTGQIVKRIPTDNWSKMVARTELSRAQTMGNLALYNAAQIEKVMYVTSQGENVCDICEPDDGQIYSLADVEGLIPQHANCACSWMAADEDVAYKEAA